MADADERITITAVGWVLVGVLLGAALMVAWHVACPTCQKRAQVWRRTLGQALIE